MGSVDEYRAILKALRELILSSKIRAIFIHTNLLLHCMGVVPEGWKGAHETKPHTAHQEVWPPLPLDNLHSNPVGVFGTKA